MKEGTMVVNTDFVPILVEQRPITHNQSINAAFLRQAAVRFLSDAGLALLTLFAVFSGFPGSQENLEKMGVSLGPNHM
jgi:hypothetical protein